jgi:DNA-binding MarR family transcriptional regulator
VSIFANAGIRLKIPNAGLRQAMASSKTSAAKRKADTSAAQHFRFDLPNFVPYRISILATLMRRALSEIYRDDPGLTEPEWKVLTTLAHDGPLPSGDIGLHMTLDRMAISRALAQLIKLKLVDRAPFERDQRMSQVDLTPYGSRVFDGLARKAAAVEDSILKTLDATEVSEFLRLINKIEMNFRAHGNARRPTLIHTATAISKSGSGETGKASRRKPAKKAGTRAKSST